MSELHVILGAGQIGTRLAQTLVERGHRVRMVRQSAASPGVAGVEVVRGDLKDPTFAAEVGRGADVVHQCTNPIYTTWAKELLPLAEGAIAAARATDGARLVVLDCLYAYGKQSPMREDSPMAPCSRKGELRKRMAARYALERERGLEVTLVRASDFVGPGMDRAALTLDRNVKRWHSNAGIEVLGDPDQPHAYSYGDDVARALARTAELRGAPFVLFAPTLAARPTRAWVEAIAARLGHDGAVSPLPRWMLSALGVFSPLLREVAEMTYQHEAPFLLDDAASRASLGFEPTPFEAQVEATARWIAAQRPGRAPARTMVTGPTA